MAYATFTESGKRSIDVRRTLGAQIKGFLMAVSGVEADSDLRRWLIGVAVFVTGSFIVGTGALAFNTVLRVNTLEANQVSTHELLKDIKDDQRSMNDKLDRALARP